MELQIKIIDLAQIFDIRHPILRTGLKRSSCAMKGDDYPGTLHFGCFENENHIAVLSMMHFPFIDDPAKKAMQLRGMAVLEEYQGLGIGSKMVAFCESLVVKRGVKIIWLNARIKAVGFYRSLGYEICSEEFDIPGVGPHFTMVKHFD